MIWFISGRIENTFWRDYPTFRNDNSSISEKIPTQAHCRFLGIDIPSRMPTPEKTFLRQLSEDFKLSHGVYIFLHMNFDHSCKIWKCYCTFFEIFLKENLIDDESTGIALGINPIGFCHLNKFNYVIINQIITFYINASIFKFINVFFL